MREGLPGALDLVTRSVDDHEKAVGLVGGLVFEDTVFWNAEAVEPGAKRRHPAPDDDVTRRRITSPVEIAAEACKLS